MTVPLIKRLCAEAPNIQVRPVEELSVVLTEWVATGRLNLAIGFPIASLAGLTWEPLLGKSIYFVERAKPGAASGGTITFAEAATHELMLTVTSQRYRAFLEGIAKPHGIEICRRISRGIWVPMNAEPLRPRSKRDSSDKTGTGISIPSTAVCRPDVFKSNDGVSFQSPLITTG